VTLPPGNIFENFSAARGENRWLGLSSGIVPCPGRTPTHYERLLRAVELYLQECYDVHTAARVSELAEFVGIDRRRLATIFRQVLGESPSKVLLKQRLDYACLLLRTTPLAITDIAVRTAFGTERTFYRAFLRAFDATPEEYRHAQTKKAPRFREAPFRLRRVLLS
jgi:transcriptional regulator GlxA family with amidase domain